MKIIHTPARFYPYIGGVENYVRDLSYTQLKNGDDVSIICAMEPKGNVNFNGIKVIKLPYQFKISNTNITLSLPYVLLRSDFDILHTYLPTPWSFDISVLVAKFKRKPVVVTYCNDLYSDNFIINIFLNIYKNTILRFLLYYVDHIIIIQPNYLSYSTLLRNYKKKISIVTPGISKIYKLKNKDKNFNIGFLSILDEYHSYKGLDYLIESMLIINKKIPKAKLLIVGEGKMRVKYEKKAKKMKIKNIYFLGKINESEKSLFLKNNHVFVLPSIDNREGFGLVLIESLSYGTPVVTTHQVGIANEIIATRCGIVVNSKDVNQLADAIIKLLKDENINKRMSYAYKLIKDRYLWSNKSIEIMNIYKKYVN